MLSDVCIFELVKTLGLELRSVPTPFTRFSGGLLEEEERKGEKVKRKQNPPPPLTDGGNYNSGVSHIGMVGARICLLIFLIPGMASGN